MTPYQKRVIANVEEIVGCKFNKQGQMFIRRTLICEKLEVLDAIVVWIYDTKFRTRLINYGCRDGLSAPGRIGGGMEILNIPNVVLDKSPFNSESFVIPVRSCK